MEISKLLAKEKTLMVGWEIVVSLLSPAEIRILNSMLIISYSLGGQDVIKGLNEKFPIPHPPE